MNRGLIIVFIFLNSIVSAQIFNPVSWEFSQKKLNENQIELNFKADIDEPWHMYSQYVEDEMIATKFTFHTNKTYNLEGPTAEGFAIEKYDHTKWLLIF